MQYTSLLVLTLCAGYVYSQGLMDMFVSFAESNGIDTSVSENDTNNGPDWDWPTDFFPNDPEPTTLPPEPATTTPKAKPDVPVKTGVPGPPAEGPSHEMDWAAHFLPNMPSGDTFVNLQNGETHQFQPGSNWVEGVNPASLDTTTTTKATTTTNATPKPKVMTTTETPKTTVLRDNKPIVPIVGGGPNTNGPTVIKPDIGNVIPTKVEEIPAVKEIPIVHPPVETPIDNTIGVALPRQGIPLGPVEISPIEAVTVEVKPISDKPKETPGNSKGVPDSWMTLYPNGKKPNRDEAAVSNSVAVPSLTQSEFWLAQNIMNSFSKNRELSMQYRNDRREKARLNRLQKKQQQQQNKNNNKSNGNQVGNQGNNNKGPQRAQVARVISTQSNRPIVGNNQRGRPQQRQICTRSMQRRGLCSTDNQSRNKNSRPDSNWNPRSNSIGSDKRRVKRMARGRGNQWRDNGQGGKGGKGRGRGGNGKGNGGQGQGRGRGRGQGRGGQGRGRNNAGFNQQVIDTHSNLGPMPLSIVNPVDFPQPTEGILLPDSLGGELIGNQGNSNKGNNKGNKGGNKNKGPKGKGKKPKEIKRLVPVDLSGLVDVTISPVSPTTTHDLSNYEKIAGLGYIDHGTPLDIPGFTDIDWNAPQGGARK